MKISPNFTDFSKAVTSKTNLINLRRMTFPIETMGKEYNIQVFIAVTIKKKERCIDLKY